LLQGRRKLRDIPPAALRSAIENLLPYPAQRALAQLAPAEFVSPAGSRHAIDYAADGGPVVEVRAQALFGLAEHPMLARGKVPLTLAITSPAGRPIQTSRDLPSFWSGTWREVAKEMRGRYPKHPWPDDPAGAVPTLKSKRASGG
jgi:ATP-dependent helicase HrpB